MDWYLMVWRNYADFDGRSRRKEYWMFMLFHVPILLLLMGLGVAGIAQKGPTDNVGLILFAPYVIYALASLVPSWAVGIRRLHDTGRSGWWILLSLATLIPFVGIIPGLIIFIFMCLAGDPGPNEYGPNPKFPEQAEGTFVGHGSYTTLGLGEHSQPFKGENRFCRNCGMKLTDASGYCGGCGAQV